ncbi:hypothetical protein J4218_03990 [Candidatus Pacearchaeota archaeon]|nr:hypothetical protein [Candidatus Pacearchaeota archaeon]
MELRKCMSLYTSEGVLRPVYLVRLGGLDYVLKLSNCSIDWERKHHSMEVAALKLVRGIEGVTQLIQDYGEIDFNSSAYYAILKEYFYGRDLMEYGEINSRIEIQLGKTLGELHEHGVVHVDLWPQNIVVS